MGTTDKSDKSVEDQVDQKDTLAEEVDAVEDAEIIEDIPADGDNTPVVDEAEAGEDAVAEATEEESPVELDEPSAADTDETESAVAEDDSAAEVETEAEEAPVDSDDTPASEADETPAASATTEEPARKGGFVPLVLGGVIAAGIGFGGAVIFGEELGIGGNSEALIAELRSELAAQKEALAALTSGQSDTNALAGGAQQAAEAAAAEVAKLSETLSANAAEVGTVAEAVATLDARLTDIEKRPLNEGLGAAAIAAYEREVKDLRELVASQKAEAAELKDKADLSAKAALARSSVSRIVAALESGAPYRAAVVDLKSATGADVPSILESHADTGVITLAALIESYPDAARAALAKARADKVDADGGNKLTNFFKTQLGARSVEARDGTDTDSILSRAEAALKSGDLAASLSEIETLAEGPKTVMSEWVAQAQTRADATQAAEDLAQSLNSN